MNKPFPQSFWVHDGLLCAGCYPGDADAKTRDAKLRGLLDCGIRQVLSLMEPDEKSHGGQPFEPYAPRLTELASERNLVVKCWSMPIRDASAPTPAVLRPILDMLDTVLSEQTPTYLHCWGGHGRTGTVIACHLIERGSTPQEAIDAILDWRADLPKNHHPFEGGQERFVRGWTGGRDLVG